MREWDVVAPGELPSGRVVTFTFTDIEGWTRLMRRLGDRYGDQVDRYLEMMAEAWDCPRRGISSPLPATARSSRSKTPTPAVNA